MRAILIDLALDRGAPTSLSQQIYDHARRQIEAGLLSPGQRLETSRRISEHLACSRNVVLEAIEKLIADGFLVSVPRSGVSVADFPRFQDPDEAGEYVQNLKLSRIGKNLMEMPDSTASPIVATPSIADFPYAAWAGVYRTIWRNPRAQSLDLHDLAGHPGLREALAVYLQLTRGIRCSKDSLMLFESPGAAMGLIARLFLDPGEQVWLEVPGFCRLGAALEMDGVRVAYAGPDGNGLDPHRAAASFGPARIAVTSAPWCSLAADGVTQAARQKLLSWASEVDGWIVERGCYGDFRHKPAPVPSLQAMEGGGRVIHLGSLSPALLPGIPMTYVVATSSVINLMAHARCEAQEQICQHLHPVLAAFIRDGHFARHAMKAHRACDRNRLRLSMLVQRRLGHLLKRAPHPVGSLLVLEFAAEELERHQIRPADLAALEGPGVVLSTNSLEAAGGAQFLLLDCLQTDLATISRQLDFLPSGWMPLLQPGGVGAQSAREWHPAARGRRRKPNAGCGSLVLCPGQSVQTPSGGRYSRDAAS